MTYLDEIKTHLRGLADGSVLPRDLYSGICGEIHYKLDVFIDNAIHRWPDLGARGDETDNDLIVFPVEGNFIRYRTNRNKWDGDTAYGKRRRALCVWLAENITEEDVV